MLQKLLSHGNAPPPDARELRPEVSDNLVAVISKMLAKDPADRYQTATDLGADLREVAFRDGLTRSQALNPVAIAQPNQLLVWFEKHAPWIVAAMLLIASAGWLQLESAALRDAVTIPDSAKAPVIAPVRRQESTVPEVTPVPTDKTEESTSKDVTEEPEDEVERAHDRRGDPDPGLFGRRAAPGPVGRRGERTVGHQGGEQARDVIDAAVVIGLVLLVKDVRVVGRVPVAVGHVFVLERVVFLLSFMWYHIC